MNWNMYKSKMLAVSLLTASLLSGCAGLQFEPEMVRTANYQENSGYKLGAELVETDDGWRFSEITDSKSEVSLGGYIYEYAIEGGNCARGVLGATEGGCLKHNLKFSSDSPNGVNIVFPIPWAFGAVAFPFALLSGNFEKAGEFFLPIFVDREFGWEDYIDAISEAKKAENYDERYPDLYNRYVELKQFVSPTPTYIPNKWTLTSQANRLKSDSVYALQKRANKQLPIKITDYSGLADTKKIQSSLKQTLSVSVGIPEVLDCADVRIERYADEKYVTHDLFPAKDLDDFDRRLATAENELVQLNTRNKGIDLKNNRNIADADAQCNKKFQRYKLSLAKKNALLTVDTTSSTQKLLDGLGYDLDLPKNASIKSGTLPKSSVVELRIKSRDYTDILPVHYQNKNEDLEAHLEGRMLVITNKTGKYITVDAFSLYHSSDVLTRGGENFQNFSELAPDTVTRIPLRHFNLNGLSKDYYGLTKQKAQQTNIPFGFAIKYRITELDVPRTLYKKNNYNLYKLILES